MARTFKAGPARKAFNAAIIPFLRLGIAPLGARLLTTRGRKTGKLYTTPVMLIQDETGRWLVAPYGEVSWVRNARAAGRVTIGRGRASEDLAIEEVGPQEAAPVLKKYVARAPMVLPFFRASRGSPLEAFEAEAADHPVFRLTPAGRGNGDVG